MNRALRNTVALFLGIVLGAFATYSYAANWTGGGIVQRNGGLATDLALPNSSSAAGVQASAMEGLLSLTSSGNWDLLDKAGNQVRVPGRDVVSIPKDAIDKAAAGTALRGAGRLGGIPGIILSALAAEAINLAGDTLVKSTTKEGETVRKFKDRNNVFHETGQAYANAACAISAQALNQQLNRALANEYTAGTNKQVGVSCQNLNQATRVYETWNYWTETAVKVCPGDIVWSGSCDLQTTQAPATEADAESAVAKRTAMADAALKDFYDALDQQGKNDLKPKATIKHNVSPTVGPPTTSTTTNPDGTTTTTSTQSTYTGSESGTGMGNHVVNITNTTTTNVTNNGNTTTTTTTEAANAPAPTKSACQENPNAVGCQELGEVPDVDLERKELEGSVVPVSVGGEGQCPAPLTANVGGQHVEMTFEPVCRVATGVRPVVIVVAWLAAAYILAGVVRGNS